MLDRWLTICALAMASGVAPAIPPASAETMVLSSPPNSAAAAPRPIRFKDRQAVLAWINRYREDPQPELVPGAVQAMANMGLLRDPEQGGVYYGFYSGVIGANQVDARKLIAATFPMPPEHQLVVIRGIADSGLPEWQDLLMAFNERMPARQVHVREYLSGKIKPLSEIPLDADPGVLDAWWGQYFATGQYEPILRILPALAWTDEKESLEKLTIGSMAKWTLASNAMQDKPLLDFLRDEVYRQPQAIAREVAKIVEAAERFEVHKIRKAQIARIEARKAKGPPKTRGWAWWSEMAGTALAVGCVVAGATGQAALGLPCIIGGAVSSATTNVLRREEALRR